MVVPALSPAGSIPIPRTRLIGREAELRAAHAFLLDEAVPLLTLTGPGGVGKTRLALAIAGDVAAQFSHGADFVDLAPLADPGLVAVTIADTLGVTMSADGSVTDAMITLLHTQQRLLIVDNCEHVLGAAADVVAAVVAGCPAVQVLATSRAPLRIRGEQLQAVPPLSVPATDSTVLDQVQAAPAVRLFVQRARAADATFALDSQNAGTVAAVCQRLDGLPLAIELAAARTNVLSPAALLALLSQRFEVLIGGPRDAPLRQQTMHETVAWSYALLSAEERAFFRSLSVFAGGWTLDAAATVSGLAILEALARLDALVDKSLVRRVEPADANAPPRFTMLESIREFALERLSASGEETVIRDRHAAWCLQVAEQSRMEPWDALPDGWLARMSVEQGNLRSAFDWLEAHGHTTEVLRLATAAADHARWHGPSAEGRERLARALALAGDRDPQLRAQALYAVGHLAWDQQDLPACIAAAEQALMLFRQLDHAGGVVHTLVILGGATTDQGDVAGGRALLEEALALSPPDRKPRDWVLNFLGMIVDLQGDDERARALLEESVALARSCGDPSLATFVAPFLADFARRGGDVVRAAVLLREAFAAYADLQAQAELAYCLEGTATLATTMGHWERAARLLGGAEALREQIGRPLDYPLRPAYERLVATVRATSGATAAWEAGRVLPLAAAVTEANDLLVAIEAGGDPQPILARPSDPVDPASSRPLVATPAAIGADLTWREQEVLSLLAQRLTDPEIAERLFLSPRTASKHVGNILAKLGAANRREAAAIAAQHGLV